MSSKSLLMTDNVLFAHIKAFFSLEAKKHKKMKIVVLYVQF